MKDNFLLIVVIVLLLVFLISIISTINKFIRLKKNMERAESTINVFLKKRYDLIPNLVEVVKGYSNYEKETLENITKLRNKFNETDDKESGKQLHDYYKNMVMTIEKYPDLKAGESYLNLQKQLSKVESEIQASRRIYINSITEYNNLVQQVPSNIIAIIFGHKEKECPKYEVHDFEIKF